MVNSKTFINTVLLMTGAKRKVNNIAPIVALYYALINSDKQAQNKPESNNKQ